MNTLWLNFERFDWYTVCGLHSANQIVGERSTLARLQRLAVKKKKKKEVVEAGLSVYFIQSETEKSNAYVKVL